MKSISRFWKPVLFLALAGIIGATSNTFAQVLPDVGVVLTCNFRGTIVINRDGRDYRGTVEGYGSFQVIASNAANPDVDDSPNQVVYVPVDISATSSFPELGDLGRYTTTLDRNARAPRSATTSINPGRDLFPVRSDMIYPPIVTDPTGNDYKSADYVNFTSDAANSFNPFTNEPFHLASSVRFSSGNGSTFTLVSLDATFDN